MPRSPPLVSRGNSQFSFRCRGGHASTAFGCCLEAGGTTLDAAFRKTNETPTPDEDGHSAPATGAGSGSDHEPSPVAARGGADRAERQANSSAADEPSRGSARGAKNFNPAERVFKRAAQCCGAVEAGGALEAHLEPNFGTFSPTRRGFAGAEWVKDAAASETQARKGASLGIFRRWDGGASLLNRRF